MAMLTREEIASLRVFLGDDTVESDELCAMALALLDIAELVPGDGELIERVRELKDELGGHSADERVHVLQAERISGLQEQLRRAETERDEARDLLRELKTNPDPLISKLAKAGEFIYDDRIKRELNDLRAKLAALLAALQEFEFDEPEILAAIADARKVQP